MNAANGSPHAAGGSGDPGDDFQETSETTPGGSYCAARRGATFTAKTWEQRHSKLAHRSCLSVLLTRLLQSQLWNVAPTDPATFAVVTFLLLVVAMVAAYFPHSSRCDGGSNDCASM
jgi:hypothetical protein